MAVRSLALVLNVLFWFALGVVVTGGFDVQGSIAGRSIRLDATSPDLLVLLFLVLAGVWVQRGRSLRDLACVKRWEAGYRWLAVASRRQLTGLLAIAACVAIAVPQVRHFSFQTGKDLALFAQAYWNTLQGDFLFSSIQGGIVLWGEHFNPIVLAVLPFYWLWPSPETLLVLQSLALVAGVIPLYALARKELGRGGIPVCLSLAYLAYLPLRLTNVFDFHPIAFATPLIVTAFYFLRTERLGRFLLFSVLVGATKETGPIAMGLLGVTWFAVNPRRWIGAALAVISGAWFILNLTVVMPAFNPEGVATQLARYSYLGKSPGEILRTLLTRPFFVVAENASSRELFYPIRILAPVAFLPVLTPFGLLLLPYLAINLLEASGIQVWLVHYQAELTAFVFIAAVFGAKKILERRPDRWLAGVLTASALLFFGTSDAYHLRKALPTAETLEIHERLERVPEDGRLSAQAALAPHLTQRKWLEIFPEVAGSEWVVVDLGLDPWPVREDRFRRTVRRLKRVGFEVELERGETRILQQTGATWKPRRRRSSD